MQAGVRHVQATINGYGERCGNANMVSILANLALKTADTLVPAGGGDLAALTQLSRSVAEIANQAPDDYQPYVGRSAFAHKGGVHGAAVAKVERSYQHVDPARSATPAGWWSRSWAARPTPRSAPASWATSWRASSTRGSSRS